MKAAKKGNTALKERGEAAGEAKGGVFAGLLRHRKAAVLGALGIVFLVMALLLWLVGSSQKRLTEQVQRQEEQLAQQNELILAMKDRQEAEDPKEINVVITSQTLEQQLNAIQELVTRQYVYTNADKKSSSEKWLWGIERPFSGKSIVVTYDGIIKAGVDLRQADIDVDEESKTITVTLPPSRITDNTIPQDRIEIVEAKNGLFNDVTLEDYNNFIAEQRLVMEQKVLDQGFLDEADNDARTLVRSVLSVLPGMESYTLKVETLERSD